MNGLSACASSARVLVLVPVVVGKTLKGGWGRLKAARGPALPTEPCGASGVDGLQREER